MPIKTLTNLFEDFAKALQQTFSVIADFNPEDQLKGPVTTIFKKAGNALLNISIEAVTEIRTPEVSGRPDIGIIVNSLLTGHVELKAPGKGANPDKFNGDDKTQWDKFKDLPNLIYTDGNEWSLYRTGAIVGKVLRFHGNIIDDGATAITPAIVSSLSDMFNDFLLWHPIVPKTPSSLAKLIAPLCRLLRHNVLESLKESGSNLNLLASEWRQYIFPNSDDAQFADAYAQTLTYALLLARLSGANGGLSIPTAVKTIRKGHRLLSDSLNILADYRVREQIEAPISLLERVIAAVDKSILFQEGEDDPWLYFYEDFLAEYDPEMRKNRGVYYTPVQVVQAQIHLVDELLQKRFNAEYSFVDPKVITLDPAAGTGTYIAAALRHGFKKVSRIKGAGMRANAATQAAKNIYAFEILVGPYAVAHLRLTQQILAEGGELPADGVQVYLTDTLESPTHPPPALPFHYKELGEEHERARKVKREVPILVCIGNPPYDRQQIKDEDEGISKRKGGWVRYGDDGGDKSKGILKDFTDPLEPLGYGVHAKNLYNDYVYFWRWALWKVFNNEKSQGIISFITASSYLYGPAFAGMRQVMRQTFNNLWIIDLGGDNLGARKSENVFAIQTPVAIAIGVKNKDKKTDTPCKVKYTRIDGDQKQKLETLNKLRHFNDLEWRECLSGWTEPFLPTSDKPYWDWPLVTDLFPWQVNGMQFKRTWPIAETQKVLTKRWVEFLKAPIKEKPNLFRETEARKIDGKYYPINDNRERQDALSELEKNTSPLSPVRYAYRSFDRQWIIPDSRLCDRPRPTLHNVHSDNQVYITSLLTNVIGEGPAAVATALIPDLDHFRGSFGAKHVIPLWRDRECTDANITAGVLSVINQQMKSSITAEDLFGYCYAVLSAPQYSEKFWDELVIPGPRLPITKNKELFTKAADMGKHLLWLHTFGERFVPLRKQHGKLPKGKAKCKKGTSSNPSEYPEIFSYDPVKQQLTIGNSGVFTNIRESVWNFSVSGLKVVKSWLSSRMKTGSGKKSSTLDKIRPYSWEFDNELLELLWVLDETVDLLPSMSKILQNILQSNMFDAIQFEKPSAVERKGPNGDTMPLFTDSGDTVESKEVDSDSD